MPEENISPIKKPLLNLPGQSVQTKLQDFIDDNFLLPGMCLALLSSLCIAEWVGYLTHAPRNPWLYTIMLAVSAIGLSLYWREKWSKLKALKLGRDGERAVAEYMEQRLDPQARKFHDVPIAHGNIDHVIICSRGVFAIETKTHSMPRLRVGVVSVGPAHLIKVDGHRPDRDPISQIRNGARDLHQVLDGYARSDFFVHPIVVYPGWSISDRREDTSGVWVIEPRELAMRIEAMPLSLGKADVSRLSSRLTRFIRAANERSGAPRRA